MRLVSLTFALLLVLAPMTAHANGKRNVGPIGDDALNPAPVTTTSTATGAGTGNAGRTMTVTQAATGAATGQTQSATEPISLALTGIALVGAALLRRIKR